MDWGPRSPPPQSLCWRMCLPRSWSHVQREPGRLGPGNVPSRVSPEILGGWKSSEACRKGDGCYPRGQTEVTERRGQEPQKEWRFLSEDSPGQGPKLGPTGSGTGRKGYTLNLRDPEGGACGRLRQARNSGSFCFRRSRGTAGAPQSGPFLPSLSLLTL